MSDLHKVAVFCESPVSEETHLILLRNFIKQGIPATYTAEERIIYEFEKNRNLISQKNENLPVISEKRLKEILEQYVDSATFQETEDVLIPQIARQYLLDPADLTSVTTPLHMICYNIGKLKGEAELRIVDEMVEELFLNGTGWNLVDFQDCTPGCILINSKMTNLNIYEMILQAGVRAEMVFRKLNESNIEFLDLKEETSDQISVEIKEDEKENVKEIVTEKNDSKDTTKVAVNEDPADNQAAYLKTKLEYNDKALITSENKDGVMMNWETKLMKLGCDTVLENAIKNDSENEETFNVLNIGFGMGIIDLFIQEKIQEIERKKGKHTKIMHYICEAHPDVIAKITADGWYEKCNVVILEGRWQDELNKILDLNSEDGNENPVYFDGVYYDTFSEHYYPDMFPNLFDVLLGLLKLDGVISFFNGLGADRQVVYEVYCRIVQLDMADYGLDAQFTGIDIDVDEEQMKNKNNDKVWDGIKRSYWNCPVYYHPKIRFQ